MRLLGDFFCVLEGCVCVCVVGELTPVHLVGVGGADISTTSGGSGTLASNAKGHVGGPVQVVWPLLVLE